MLHCAPKYLGLPRSGKNAELAEPFSADTCWNVCAELGCNSRYIARVLHHSDRLSEKAVLRYTKREVERMVNQLHERFAVNVEGFSKQKHRGRTLSADEMRLVVELALADASLLVRAKADDDVPSLPAGKPAVAAVLRAAEWAALSATRPQSAPTPPSRLLPTW